MKHKVFNQSVTKKALVLLSFVFIISSCQQEVIEPASVGESRIERINNESANYIPYADSLDLAVFKSDNEVINYELSRKLALLELEAAQFRQEFAWEGYDISEKPVLIYGYDSRPKYYEFVMLDAEGNPSGTVKTFAKKVSDGVLTEVRDGVRDYQAIVSKSPGGMKFFEGAGGKLLVGLPSKSGDQPTTLLDTETGEAVEPGKELTDEEKLEIFSKELLEEQQQKEKLLDTLSNDTLKQKLVATDTVQVEEQITELKTTMDESHENRDTYWEEVENFADSLLVLSDEDIGSKATKWGWFRSFFSRMFSPKVETVDASLYKRASADITYSTGVNGGRGDCGPFALSWMYKAKYNKNVDKYSYFSRYTIGIGGGRAMFPTQIKWSYLNASSWKTYISWYCHGRDNAHSHIKHRDNPIIILKWLSGGEFHWVVGWESKREKNWYFWDKHWFTVNDNSAFGNEGESRNDKEFYRRKYRASWPFVFLKVYESKGNIAKSNSSGGSGGSVNLSEIK